MVVGSTSPSVSFVAPIGAAFANIVGVKAAAANPAPNQLPADGSIYFPLPYKAIQFFTD